MTEACRPDEQHPPVPAPASAAGPAGRIFISYAAQDGEIASQLCAAIEAAGVLCWIAPRDVRPGESYAAAIVNAINDSRMLVLVLILSRHAIDSPHVQREVERASSKRRPVLSIRLDGSALPPELEYFLSANQWLDASGGPIGAHCARARRGRARSAPRAWRGCRPRRRPFLRKLIRYRRR